MSAILLSTERIPRLKSAAFFRPRHVYPPGLGNHRLDDFTAAQAPRADIDPLDLSRGKLGLDPLQVGFESALGFIVRMTDMKADHWFFPTYRALLGHIVPPLTLFYWGSKPCVLKQRKL